MATKKEEQLARLAPYLKIMGLSIDDQSIVKSLQESVWSMDADTIKLRQLIPTLVRQVSRRETIDLKDWLIDEQVLMDLCLLLTIIWELYSILYRRQVDTEGAEKIFIEYNRRNLGKAVIQKTIQFDEKRKSIKTKSSAVTEAMVSAFFREVNEEKDNLLAAGVPVDDTGKIGDEFLKIATYALSRFLNEYHHEISNVRIPELILSFYYETGIYPPAHAVKDPDYHRRTISNWIRKGEIELRKPSF